MSLAILACTGLDKPEGSVAREVAILMSEETGAEIDISSIVPLWFASSEPKPNRVVLFSPARPIAVSALPTFHEDAETSERGLVFGPDGLAEVFAFPLHVEAARRYFAERGITGTHAFATR